MQTIPDMLIRVLHEHAHRTAVVDGETRLTYADLERAIASRATHLLDAGVVAGDRVGLLLPNGADFVISYFAIMLVGARVVPLNEQYRHDDLLHFLHACNTSAVVTAGPYRGLCGAVVGDYGRACAVLFVDERRLDPGVPSCAELMAWVEPLAPAMFQFSSGSTGTPKRIARNHQNILFEMASLQRALDLTCEDRFLGVAPFSHVNGMMRSMMACMCAGGTLYPLAKFGRHAVASLVEKERLTVFIAVPFMFSILAEARFKPPPDFSSLRWCISASAPMPSPINQRFHDQFGQFVRQLYGSTETGTISVNLDPEVESSLDSVGTEIPGVQIAVIDDHRLFLGPDQMGEFAVKSPAAIQGYDGLDAINRASFHDGWFLTGDLGYRAADGCLYLKGRKKFFINKGGYKIDPREIEELFEEHAAVREAIAVGVPSSYGDEKVKVVVVAEGACTEWELVEHCRGRIADFKIPSLIEFRESLPRSPTGKVRRKLLAEANE